MKKVIVGGLSAIVLLSSIGLPSISAAQTTSTTPAPVAEASTTTTNSKVAQIEALLKLLRDLQAQLAAAKGELADVVKTATEDGVSSAEIKAAQEILATDRTLFPRAKADGKLGSSTNEAIKRFQKKFGLEETGKLDAETREAFKQLNTERKADGKFPIGFLRKSEIRNEIRDHLKDKRAECDFKRSVKSAICENIKERRSGKKAEMKDEDEDDDSDDESDDEDDDSDVGNDDDFETEENNI